MATREPNSIAASHDRAKAPPVMTILSDHPILRDESEELNLAARESDAFELHTRLGAVYDIIRHKNTRAPLAIGVFGDWGTGKSSAMRWLADQLNVWSGAGVPRGEHFSTRCVWFEPWKYQTREDVWRGLIAEVVINSIDPSEATVATVVSAVKKFGTFLGRSFIHAVSSMKLKPRAEVNAGAAKAGAEVEINLDALTKIAEDYKQTAHPEKAYLNEFESTLKAWVSGSLGENERMVLFIDDLDRCLPGVVLEVLEALKLYLSIPQLIFVIGLDRDVVKAVVRKQYAEAGLPQIKADSYLDKMFQVEVEVPPSEHQMDGYFAAQVKELDNATDNYWTNQLNMGGTGWANIIEKAVKDIAVHNPREVKRLLNSTLMGGAAAARKAKDPQDAANRFGQGCQAYLIARVLRDMDGNPAATLRFKETWAFLAKWSKFRADYKDYRPDLVERSDAKTPGERGPEKDDPKRKEAEDELRRLMPRTRDAKRQPFPLWDMSILWDLLAIECSPEVGQAVASRATDAQVDSTAQTSSVLVASAGESVTGSAASDASVDAVNRLPLTIRSRIAKQLGKDAKALTASDLTSLTTLDMSGSDLDDGGLRELSSAETGLKALAWLNLSETQTTDAGIKELARSDTGLKALVSLTLNGTQVTDAGVKELARVDTGLKALTTLWLNATQVTDAGVKELCRANTSLKDLRSLNLRSTKVTDVGVKELARAATGLKDLTKLYLYDTQVTDAGVKELGRADTGLKSLTLLDLSESELTDAGLKELARADTGLKSLTTLYINGTDVTDAGIKELVRADTGLKALTSLTLNGTRVTDEGVQDLARPDTGLKALTELRLWQTETTDASLVALAAPDTGLTQLQTLVPSNGQVTQRSISALADPNTGLKALTSLNVSLTQVTDAGVKELARPDTGLKALTSLNLSVTPVTDAGIEALARPDTGLKALTLLNVSATKVTDAGVAAVKARFAGINILR